MSDKPFKATPSSDTIPPASSTPATGATVPPSGMGASSDQGSHGGSDRLKQSAEDLRDSVKSSAQEGRRQVESSLQDAKHKAVDRSEQAKNTVADEIGRTGDALDTAASEVDEGSIQQQLLREAADGLTRISGSMKNKNLGAIVSDISDFGRRNPAAFLGGAMLVGFAFARFARASEKPRATSSYGPGRASTGDAYRSDYPSTRTTTPVGSATKPMGSATPMGSTSTPGGSTSTPLGSGTSTGSGMSSGTTRPVGTSDTTWGTKP